MSKIRIIAVAILGLILITNYIAILIIKEYRDAKLRTFRCKECLHVNKTRRLKCHNCGAELPEWVGYGSLFRGEVDCRPKNKKFLSRRKVKAFARFDINLLYLISFILSFIIAFVVSDYPF